MLAKIPLNKEEYSLYVSGFLVGKYYDEKKGTLLQIKDNTFSILFFTYSNYRRAYIVCDSFTNLKEYPYLEGKLPLIKEKLKVLYTAEGRKIDLLKFICYKIDNIYNNSVYEFGIDYWSKFISFIDLSKKHKERKTQRQIFDITEQYLLKRRRLNGVN